MDMNELGLFLVNAPSMKDSFDRALKICGATEMYGIGNSVVGYGLFPKADDPRFAIDEDILKAARSCFDRLLLNKPEEVEILELVIPPISGPDALQ